MKKLSGKKWTAIDAMWIYTEEGEPVCNLMRWKVEAKKAEQRLARMQRHAGAGGRVMWKSAG
jgi:hypothetical protein